MMTKSPFLLHRTCRPLARLALFATFLAPLPFLSTPAQAQLLGPALPALDQPTPTQEVAVLMQKGRFAEALVRVEPLIAAEPDQARPRFMKGVILSELGRKDDAIALFNQLKDDFPELPEPYNNLGVLYAGQGRFEMARAALEMAVVAHPGYAVAHENLGDIYARMAGQEYDKAKQVDPASGAGKKLALMRDLLAKPSRPAADVTTPAKSN